MGKQAKPKPASQKGTQRKHNPKTRWINTKKPDLLWNPTLIYDIVDEDLPNGEKRTRYIQKPFEELKNKLHEPYDDLLLDWEVEIQHFAVESEARIEREAISTGGTRYTVYKEYVDGARTIRKNLLVVETPRAVSFAPKKHGKKKQKKGKEEAAAPTQTP